MVKMHVVVVIKCCCGIIKLSVFFKIQHLVCVSVQYIYISWERKVSQPMRISFGYPFFKIISISAIISPDM